MERTSEKRQAENLATGKFGKENWQCMTTGQHEVRLGKRRPQNLASEKGQRIRATCFSWYVSNSSTVGMICSGVVDQNSNLQLYSWFISFSFFSYFHLLPILSNKDACVSARRVSSVDGRRRCCCCCWAWRCYDNGRCVAGGQASSHGVHERPAGRARERIPLQPVPVSTAAHRAGATARPFRATDKDLVSESTHEAQERSLIVIITNYSWLKILRADWNILV